MKPAQTRSIRPSLTVILNCSLLTAALVPLIGVTAASAADSSTNFNVPGSYTYVVPSGTSALQVTVAGSAGARAARGSGTPGNGAVITGVLQVTPDSTLAVDVGGLGYVGGPEQGGNAGNYGSSYQFTGTNAGGGGSDIGTPFGSPLIIAAGGGGAGGSDALDGVGGNGGAAGTSMGSSGTGCSVGGSQGGGAGGSTSGGNASGGTGCGGLGNGLSASGSAGGSGGVGQGSPGGGGGGGFAGGGGGTGSSPGGTSGGGGGGASWVDQSIVTVASVAASNVGGGSVIITPLSPAGLIQQTSQTPGASDTCKANGGPVIIDSTTEGVHTSLYTYQRPAPAEELDVCFRADVEGIGAGGMVAITPAAPGISITGVEPPSVVVPSIGTPSTDGHSSYCSSPPAGSPPNGVAGSHPISSGTLPGGTTFAFDTYSDLASTAWVCIQVGSLVTDRVVVPLALPSVGVPTITTPWATVSSGYVVTFTPDPGTP